MDDDTPILPISPPPIYDDMLRNLADCEIPDTTSDMINMDDGKLTQVWQDWFSQLQITLNQIINSL